MARGEDGRPDQSDSGKTEALRGIDLADSSEATVLGVLGPNGAGKTTAVRILATLIRPDGGRAFVDGVDVVADPRPGPSQDRSSPVRTRLLDDRLTGRENIEYVGRLNHLPAHATREEASRGAPGAVRPDRRRPTGRPRATRAGCAGASTSP